MRINELAKQLNITARTIRYYEEKGLLHPNRDQENDYRTYTEDEAWRLQAIVCLREIGMKIEDIKQVLARLETEGKSSVKDYLELQRSAIYAQWLELKQMIDVTDQMIRLVEDAVELPLDKLYQLSLSSKQLRELRTTWIDKWNFDHQAEQHDQNVKTMVKYKDYELALEIAVQLVAPGANEAGLDIGTGTGNLAHQFLRMGASMSAVDQSLNMLKQCRAKYPTIEAKQGNFLVLPFPEHSFDFAVSSYAFHLLNDEQKGLAIMEMRRVLKPYGRICIVDLMDTHSCDERDLAIPSDVQLRKVEDLIKLFEDKGYLTKHVQVNPKLHAILAVPIKGEKRASAYRHVNL